jgi:hypothetical protein
MTANRTRTSAGSSSASKKAAGASKKAGSGGTKKTTSDSSAKKATAGGAQRTASRRASAPRAESKPRRSGVQVAADAAEQLATLIRTPVEAVTGLSRTEDGWRVELEVLEMRRIPESTDVLALYEVEADEDGNLTSYRRIERYVRGRPGGTDR